MMKDRRDESLEEVLLQAAAQFAQEAGALIRQHVGQMGQIQQKMNRSDLVTEVDKRSESLLRTNIQQHFPDHWILSEEENGQANSYEAFTKQGDGYGWVVDPIDGTTNFIHGMPHFAVSIGIVRAGEVVIGVVYNPMTDELFTARRGHGAFCAGKRMQVGREARLEEAVLATGFQAREWRPGSRVLQQMDRLAGACRNLRMIGAASLDLCWIASGRLTGFWHEGLHPWDCAAGMLIVQEAGGTVTNREGDPFLLHHDSLVASNGPVHARFLEVLRDREG
jgi:myo-inositol-1(or 4)-monophosphatase